MSAPHESIPEPRGSALKWAIRNPAAVRDAIRKINALTRLELVTTEGNSTIRNPILITQTNSTLTLSSGASGVDNADSTGPGSGVGAGADGPNPQPPLPPNPDGPPTYDDIWVTLSGVGIAHRERGGTATLVGKNEPECEASSPPKKYRTATRVGSYTLTEYNELGCPGGTERGPGDVYTYSGGDSWDVATGDHTSDEELTVEYITAGTTVVTSIPLGETTPCPASTCDFTITTSPTGWTQTVTGACCSGGFFPQKASGEGTVLLLADEDTEQDAINRLIASVGDWGSWDSCFSWPCGMSKWTIRTTGFDFEYIVGQWRVEFYGATALVAIMVTITFVRTDLETSEVDYFVLRFSGAAGGGGSSELTGDLPIQRGFMIQIYGVEVSAAENPGTVFGEG